MYPLSSPYLIDFSHRTEEVPITSSFASLRLLCFNPVVFYPVCGCGWVGVSVGGGEAAHGPGGLRFPRVHGGRHVPRGGKRRRGDRRGRRREPGIPVMMLEGTTCVCVYALG